MLGNDRMETASTAVTSIERRNDIEKSTWRTHRHFVDFESRIHFEISKSNRCHTFHVHLSFKIMKSRRTFRVEFQCRINGNGRFVHWFNILKPIINMKRRSTAWCKLASFSRKQHLLKSIYFHFKTPTKNISVFFRTKLGKGFIWQKFSATSESDLN